METPRQSPVHDLAPGKRVELFEGTAVARWEGAELQGSAKAWFDWSAGTCVEIEGTGEPSGIAPLHHDPQEIVLQGIGAVPFADAYEREFSSSGWRIGGHISRADIGNPTARLARIDFQIGNFFLYTRTQRDNDSRQPAYRLALKGGGWRVVIDAVDDAQDRLRQLRRDKTASTMHAGRLARVRGGTFTWGKGERVLNALTTLLSFAAGDRAPILLPVGYDRRGSAMVRQWGDPKREPYQGRLQWCSPQRVGALETVWPTFVNLWHQDADAHQMVQVAVELYIEAQRGNIETRLVAAQAANELVAWYWLTTQSPKLDPRKVDGEKASWRMRRMLERIGVDAGIPTSLPATRAQWPGKDGPHVVSDLRNSIIHPKDVKALLSLSTEVKFEVLRLAMWYVDLALLRLLDFDGEYLNRTARLPFHERAVSRVPWARSP